MKLHIGTNLRELVHQLEGTAGAGACHRHTRRGAFHAARIKGARQFLAANPVLGRLSEARGQRRRLRCRSDNPVPDLPGFRRTASYTNAAVSREVFYPLMFSGKIVYLNM